jgi:hypothetical protein
MGTAIYICYGVCLSFLRRGTNSNFGMLVTLLLVGCFDVRLI